MDKIAVVLIVGILFVLVLGAVPAQAHTMGIDVPIVSQILDAVVSAFQWIVAAIIEVAAALLDMPI